MVSLRVLGDFAGAHADGSVDLGGPRQRSVLARLLVARGRVVAADLIVEDLWRGEPPPRAMGALQAYVSHLRRALEPDRPARAPAQVLVSAAPGYAIRLPDEAVDAWHFEALVRDGAARAEHDPATARPLLDRALALWQGQAYGEFAHEPWAEAEAARLQELRLVAVEHRAEAALALGMAAESVPDLEALTGEQPLREEAWRLLALALYRAGRQGDALGALRRARAVLSDELGVDPGPVLQRLEADVLAQAPDLELARTPQPVPPVAPAAATGPDVRPDAPPEPNLPAQRATPATETALFVGRDTETALLDKVAATARSGRCELVLVAGDPGEGKTALIRDLYRRLQADGWAVARGRCPEYDGAPAGWAWSELLRDLTAARPAARDIAEVLAPLVDENAAGRPLDGDDGGARFRLHRAVGAYLAGTVPSTGLLLVLDDLHRADAESLALLVDALQALRAKPALVVATYRRAEVGDRLTATFAEVAPFAPHRIDLRGLHRDDVAQVVAAVAGREPDRQTVDAIVERTGGNPFYVRESARLLASEGELVARTEVPAGVRDVLRRRLSRLPASAQTVLKLAAVIGRDIDVDVLVEAAEASETAEDQVLDALDAGLVSGLLEEPEAGRVRFSHVLVRDTLYDEVSRLRRARLHGRVATAIEAVRPNEFAALAHHFSHAASSATAAQAASYAVHAAGRAEERYAYLEAVRLYEQALQDLVRVPGATPQQQVAVLTRLVRALGHAGQIERAREAREQAVRLAAGLNDHLLTAAALSSLDVPSLWAARRYANVDETMLRWVRESLAAVPEDNVELRCALMGVMASELEGEGDPETLALCEEAVALARGTGNPRLVARTLNALYFVILGPDDIDRRRAIGEELMEIGQRHDLPGYEMLAHQLLAPVLLVDGDLDAASAHNRRAAGLGRALGQPFVEVQTRFFAIMELVIEGRLDVAQASLEAVLGIYHDFNIWDAQAVTWLMTLMMRHETGGLADLVEPTRQIHQVYGDLAADPYALVLLAAGRREEARAVWAPDHQPRRDYLFLHQAAMRAECALAFAEPDRIQQAYDLLAPYSGQLAGASAGTVTLGPVDLLLGDLASALGRDADATRHHQQALELCRRLGAPRWAAQAEGRLAGADVSRTPRAASAGAGGG